MEILFVNLGSLCDCFVSTCVLRGLRKVYNNPNIDVLVSDEEHKLVFKYSKNVKNVFCKKDIVPDKIYDVLINLSPDELGSLTAKEMHGFGTENGNQFYDVLFGEKKINKNIFQVYYNLSGMAWHGESYDFRYNPKCRQKKNRTGILVANTNLKRYIIEKLKLDKGVIWEIPFKTNMTKRLDEINKCTNVITDDFFTMHMSIYLRKYVFFLETLPKTTKTELFGNGKVFDIPSALVK